MDESARKELLLIGFLLLVMLGFAILATAIFVRQWRREKKKTDATSRPIPRSHTGFSCPPDDPLA